MRQYPLFKLHLRLRETSFCACETAPSSTEQFSCRVMSSTCSGPLIDVKHASLRSREGSLLWVRSHETFVDRALRTKLRAKPRPQDKICSRYLWTASADEVFPQDVRTKRGREASVHCPQNSDAMRTNLDEMWPEKQLAWPGTFNCRLVNKADTLAESPEPQTPKPASP